MMTIMFCICVDSAFYLVLCATVLYELLFLLEISWASIHFNRRLKILYFLPINDIEIGPLPKVCDD